MSSKKTCSSTEAAIGVGPPQLWIECSNGRFRNSAFSNPHVGFIEQFTNGTCMYGDNEFYIWIARRPPIGDDGSTSSSSSSSTSSSTSSSSASPLPRSNLERQRAVIDLLDWAAQLPDPGGWLRNMVRSIRDEAEERRSILMQDPTRFPARAAPRQTRRRPARGDVENFNDIQVPKPSWQSHSLASLLGQVGFGFDRFNETTEDIKELKYEALKYVVQHQVPLTSEPLIQLRVLHIEEVEFSKASEIDDNGSSLIQISRIHKRLNQKLSSGTLPQHAEEFIRFWFPLDEDQLYVVGNQYRDLEIVPVTDDSITESSSSLAASAAAAATASSSSSSSIQSTAAVTLVPVADDSPLIIRARQDGNFSMYLVATRKYNYILAFATS
jgi:hypothetical protein